MQRLKAYLLGMYEFRLSSTTSFEDLAVQDAYEAGRDMAHRLTLRKYEQTSDTPTLPIEPVYTIYIEMAGGCVQGIRGDQLPTDCQIDFVIRDQDDIEQGDPDPQPPGYVPEVHYY